MSERQIVSMLRQAEGGVLISVLCREHGMSTTTFYNRRAGRSVMGWGHWPSVGLHQPLSMRRAVAAACCSSMRVNDPPICLSAGRMPARHGALDHAPGHLRDVKRDVPDALGEPERQNVTWSMGVVADRPEDGRAFRPPNLLDDFNREGVGIALAHMQPGQPRQNAYIARCNRTVRHECLDQCIIKGIEEARHVATSWLNCGFCRTNGADPQILRQPSPEHGHR